MKLAGNMKCKACGETLKDALYFAIIQDLGATVYPSSNYCPGTKDHKHQFEDAEERMTNDVGHVTKEG